MPPQTGSACTICAFSGEFASCGSVIVNRSGPNEHVRDMETTDNSKAPGLVRGLGVWSATAIVIGSMIGTAIFLVPSEISRDVGSVAQVVAVWLIGGVMVLFGAFCYAERGAPMPEEGG